MRSIDEGWESGDTIYLDDVEKCTKSHLVEVNGSKNYVFVDPQKKDLLGRIAKIFNGKITLHYTDLCFSTTVFVKNGSLKGAVTSKSSDLIGVYWVDGAKRMAKNGMKHLCFYKTNEAIKIDFVIKHKNKILSATIFPNNKIWFGGRGRYLKKFMCCDIKDYNYYANLIHSIVP